MWKSMDLKSLLIGGLTALLVMCAMGGWPEGGGGPVLNSDLYGRFTITVTSETYGGAHAYVLDTATGQVWEDSGATREEFFTPKILLAEPNDFDL